MKKYPVSVFATHKACVTHTACVVMARNADEARGQGYRIAHKLYPRSEGYFGHDVNVSEPDTVVSPETAVLLKGEPK